MQNFYKKKLCFALNLNFDFTFCLIGITLHFKSNKKVYIFFSFHKTSNLNNAPKVSCVLFLIKKCNSRVARSSTFTDFKLLVRLLMLNRNTRAKLAKHLEQIFPDFYFTTHISNKPNNSILTHLNKNTKKCFLFLEFKD